MIMRIYAHGDRPSLRPLGTIRYHAGTLTIKQGSGIDADGMRWTIPTAVIEIAPDNWDILNGVRLY